jgi:uncharacterized protein (DUF169 family)
VNTQNMWLEAMLDLARQPVGIRFLYNDELYNRCETAEASAPLPYCLAVRNASLGTACKLNIKKMACLSGARALGVLKSEEDIVSLNDISSGHRSYQMGLYANYAISHQVAKDMVYCQHQVQGIEIKPLSLYTASQPDVVIIVTNSLNMMRIVQGYAYHFGQLKDTKVTGNQAICQECTSYPFERDQVNLSFLCSGTRHVAKWHDDEISIGIPFHYLDKIIDGICQTANPMDSNKAKKLILQKAAKYGLSNQIDIKLGNNYYTGGYGTLEYHRRKNNQIIK